MLPELLLIEDDPAQAAWVQHTLSSLLSVVWVDNGKKAMTYLESKSFPLILLDLKLGSTDGVTLLSEMRNRKLIDDGVKIIALTSSEDEEEINGAHLADINEVIHKPVKSSILKSLLQKYLRQIIVNRSGEYRKGPLRFSLAEKNVFLENKDELIKLDISVTCFKILLALAKASGAILTRDQLLDCLGDEGTVGERVIDVHINSIRNLDKYFKNHISTHRGIGYCLQVE